MSGGSGGAVARSGAIANACAADRRGARDTRVDALRGLAILLVVMGHAAFVPFAKPAPAEGLVALGGAWVERAVATAPVFNVAYSVHMPLFAFLSGWVLFGHEGRSGGRLVARRAAQLLLPYAVWTLVTTLVSGAAPSALPSKLATAALYPQTGGAPWFLYALFGSYCVFAAVRGASRRPWALALSGVLAVLVSVIPQTRFGDILGIYDIAWLYPFLALGWLTASRRDALESRRRVLLPAAAVAYVVLLALLWPVMAPELNPWYPPLREALHAIGLPGAYPLLTLVRYACAAAGAIALHLAFESVAGLPARVLAWLGTRTLGIYVAHRFFVEWFSRVTTDLVLITVVSLGGAIVVTLILERWKPTRAVFLGGGRGTAWSRGAAAPGTASTRG